MYQFASAGGPGSNFHGGGYGWYTPIAGTRGKGIRGPADLLRHAAVRAGRRRTAGRKQARPEEQAPRLTAYAIRNDAGGMKVAAFNKSVTRSVSLTIDAGQRAQRVRSLRRHAPRVDDPTDATFGGGPGVLRRRMVGVEGRSIDGRKRSGGSLISPLQARP